MFQLAAGIILFLVTFVNLPMSLAQSRGTSQAQRGQRGATAKPPTPLTLRQVLESLSSQRNSLRVEDTVAKAGVQFQATPAVVDILKQFGASAKLISMIPLPPKPPAPPTPPAVRIAGPLTVICEPKDCAVIINDRYEGPTNQNRKTVTGLRPGEATVVVFADGYQGDTRRIQLEEGKPAEEKFSIKRSTLARQESGSASLLKAVASLGGAEGLAELGDIEGFGTMEWTNNAGVVEQWPMTFHKRIGTNITVTYKTREGQCTASTLKIQGASGSTVAPIAIR